MRYIPIFHSRIRNWIRKLDTRTRKHVAVYVHNRIFCDTVLGTVEGIIGVGLHFSVLEMLGVFLCMLHTARLPFVY
jgi:lauroyl/myristoyl acyltransferase